MPETQSQKPSGDDNAQRVPSQIPSVVSKDGPNEGCKDGTSNKYPRVQWRFVRDIVFSIGIFAGVSVIVLHTAEWLQGRVDQAVTSKLSDDKVLRQIAEQVRPALIFDANEAIIENMGAASYIADNGKGIHMTKEPDGWPRHIHIDFTKQFANPPILTSMYEITTIIPKHGKGFSWDFDVSDVVAHGQVIMSTNLWLYRLELVP
jgi:hypothetical protein